MRFCKRNTQTIFKKKHLFGFSGSRNGNFPLPHFFAIEFKKILNEKEASETVRQKEYTEHKTVLRIV